MSSNPQHGSPGAPHLSYSTPATGRRSSYASVAAGAPSAAFSPHQNAPASFGAARRLSVHSAPSDGQFQRPSANEYTSRIPQPAPDLDTQADVLGSVPRSWGSDAGSMAYISNIQNKMGNLEQPFENFFIPSYLRESRYIEKLEAAHRFRIAAQHASRTFNTGSLSKSASSASLQKMAPSHRGMTYDIVENQLNLEDEGPAPLPSKWKSKDKWGGLEILPSETDVRFVGVGSKLTEHDAAATRTDHPMPTECGIYYYEVTIVHKGKDGMIGVGFSGSKASLEKLPGWEPDSWGYHGDDGMSFCCQSTGKAYAEQFTTGDVIGCGVDFTINQAFFTKNGVFLGYAFKEIRNIKLYPSVGMKRPQAHVNVNFGQRPFNFDIDGHVRNKKETIREEIDFAPTDIISSLTKGEISKALVAQYLSHDGYNEAAKAFSQEVRSENHALLGTGESSLDPFLVADEDFNAVQRQTIRTAILDGQIDTAIELINTCYSTILDEHPTIYFQLKCRKFIEMMREISENNQEIDTLNALRPKPFPAKTLGPAYFDDNSMDIDKAPPPQPKKSVSSYRDADEMDTDDGNGAIQDSEDLDKRHQELLKEAVLYGKELKQLFKADQSQLVTETMTKIFGMIAYKDPSESDQAYLLEKSQRGPVAEAVNSAILVLLGKPSSTVLETLYKQTSVLVEVISEDGGVGSFVNVRKVLEGAKDPIVDVDSAHHQQHRH